MNNTQLKTYPYKRDAIRATLLSLLSDDHIRNVSPTTRRLVERNLKADWCQALSPPPANDSEVEEEAKVAKEMSILALKSPSTSLLQGDDIRPSSAHSTMTVNAVADADLPHLRRNRNSKGSLKETEVGQTAAKELPIMLEKDFAPASGPGHGPDSGSILPSHNQIRERRPSRGPGDLLGSSVSALSLIGRKGRRVPPPRPPKTNKSLKGSQSQPATPPDTSAEELTEANPLPSIRARDRRAPPPTPSRSKRRAEAEQSALAD